MNEHIQARNTEAMNMANEEAPPMQEPQMTQAPEGRMAQGGHLYTQTNEIRNSVIHYLWALDGKITEVERCLTGGSGSGSFNYRSAPIGILTDPNPRVSR